MSIGEIQLEKFYDENDQEIDPTFLDITDVSGNASSPRLALLLELKY